ncbi:MAG: hypothetical protein R6U96_16550 [Promethearchaeia archaeon]
MKDIFIKLNDLLIKNFLLSNEMINEEKRKQIIKLIRRYETETGNEAISQGSVTKEFQKWRKNLEKDKEEPMVQP